MSIHKVKFRCTNCKHLWVDAPEALLDPVEIPIGRCCPECGGAELKLSLYNDTIANFDDDVKFDNNEESNDY